MLSEIELFEQFAGRIKALPERDEYSREDLFKRQFRIYKREPISMYYAPFDHINTKANVVLVGVTPGWTQLQFAYQEARLALRQGAGKNEVCRRVKIRASFGGSMRPILTHMLDEIGLHEALDIQSCDDLFESASMQLHSTSAIRYPVFKGRQNYSGRSPYLLQEPFLREMIYSRLLKELKRLPNALVIPLGDCAADAIKDIISNKLLDESRCLIGVPHPSGINSHRHTHFPARRDALRDGVEAWFARQI